MKGIKMLNNEELKILAIVAKINMDEEYPTLQKIAELSPLNKTKTLSVLISLENNGLVDSGNALISLGTWSRVWVLEEDGFKIIENYIEKLKQGDING